MHGSTGVEIGRADQRKDWPSELWGICIGTKMHCRDLPGLFGFKFDKDWVSTCMFRHIPALKTRGTVRAVETSNGISFGVVKGQGQEMTVLPLIMMSAGGGILNPLAVLSNAGDHLGNGCGLNGL